MEQGAWQPQPGPVQHVPRLRPLGVGQKLDAAIKLTTRNFATLATIFVILLGPLELISFLTTVSTVPDDFTVGGPFGEGATTEGDESDAFVTGQAIVLLIQFVAVFFLTPAASFRAIAGAYFGEPRRWRESVGYALRRLHSILWIALLVILMNAVAFIVTLVLVAILGPFGLLGMAAALFWLNTVFAFAVPVLLLEGEKGVKALSRSFTLVTDNFWRTFGALLAAWLLVLFISFVVGAILGAVTVATTGDDTVTSLALTSLANLIADVITAPFLAALIIVAYLDLRVRKEAFDLQVLANAMGGRAAIDALTTKPSPWVAPPGWAPPPAWGQPQPGWGHPQQQGWPQPPPPGPAPQQPFGQPPPSQPQWGAPQPAQQPWGPAPQGQPPPTRWEPPVPPPEPPAPPQRWEPPVPPEPPAPAAPDPPDRSSS